MSKNIRLIIDNLHDETTVTATSEALPASNTQRSGRSYVWRSTGVGEQVLTASFPTSRFLNAVVILDYNFSLTASLRFELLIDDDVVYDSGIRTPGEIKPLGIWMAGVDPWGQSDLSSLPTQQYVVWLPELTLCNKYRITIDDPLNPDGYIQIGRIFSGEYYSPEYNPEYGLTFEWQDFSENVRTESGSLRSIGTGTARLVSFELPRVKQRGIGELTQLMMSVGREKDVYINIYPERGGLLESEHAFAARRRNNYAHTHSFYGNWQTALQYEEV